MSSSATTLSPSSLPTLASAKVKSKEAGLPIPQFISFIIILWAIRRIFKAQSAGPPALHSVAILVLGDVGRSPRMMYHAESFAKMGFATYLIGYEGSNLIPSLRELPNFQCLGLSEPPLILRVLPFILAAPFKILHQIFTIVFALFVRVPHPPEFILVQNPPSIPTLALVSLAGWLRGSKVIIDWHNLGYSILALRLGPRHPLVFAAKWFEAYFGRLAYAHLFVTHAMRDHLVREWDLEGHKVVLHDRPPAHFHRCTPEEIHGLFVRLSSSLSTPSLSSFLPSYELPFSTPFTTTRPFTMTSPSSSPAKHLPSAFRTLQELGTYEKIETPSLRDDRPVLLVSSTSWTPDEDFSILLEALASYEYRARNINALVARSKNRQPDSKNGRLPKLLAIVTGRGAMRDMYMAEVARLQEEEAWEWVRCVSLWLEADDYPLLLGSADLGVSLHASSSALDLPMKIVDMFGCGLPVCALDFACLHELVKEGVNGLTFHDADELVKHLEALLMSFPNAHTLMELRTSLLQTSNPAPDHLSLSSEKGDDDEWVWSSWSENWNLVVKPLLLRDLQANTAYQPPMVVISDVTSLNTS